MLVIECLPLLFEHLGEPSPWQVLAWSQFCFFLRILADILIHFKSSEHKNFSHHCWNCFFIAWLWFGCFGNHFPISTNKTTQEPTSEILGNSSLPRYHLLARLLPLHRCLEDPTNLLPGRKGDVGGASLQWKGRKNKWSSEKEIKGHHARLEL